MINIGALVWYVVENVFIVAKYVEKYNLYFFSIRAKVRYSPHWPALVVEVPTDLKVPKNNYFVRFFGSENL